MPNNNDQKSKKLLWVTLAIVASILLLGTPIVLTLWVPASGQTKLNNVFVGVQAAGTILAVLALIAAFSQVREARKQLKDNRAWNRMSFALTYLPQFEMLLGWEKDLDNSFLRLIRRAGPLSEEEVRQIFAEENHHVRLMLKTYMNALEAYCVAINCGLAHEEVAKRFWGYKLVRHFIELHPYITHVRAQGNNNTLFSELERVYRRWSKEIEPQIEMYGSDSE